MAKMSKYTTMKPCNIVKKLFCNDLLAKGLTFCRKYIIMQV